MIFEGSEKKAEIIIDKEKLNLLELDNSLWAKLVAKANATILSHIENEYIKAFLLSESSLFVYQDRILIITCGQTTLIDAINFFINELGKLNIKQLIFQRKNEYFSYLQPTTFFDDIKILEENFEGQAFRMGNMDDHHNFVYHLRNAYCPDADDRTFELLLYEISPKARDILMKEDVTKVEIRIFLRLEEILPDFQIDDFVFKPYGYSLNAIRGQEYFTIHITPQEESSYVSFETDINLKDHINKIIEAFEPGAYDFIEFRPESDGCGKTTPGLYELKTQAQSHLSCGYTMYFSHFYKKREGLLAPFSIL